MWNPLSEVATATDLWASLVQGVFSTVLAAMLICGWTGGVTVVLAWATFVCGVYLILRAAIVFRSAARRVDNWGAG